MPGAKWLVPESELAKGLAAMTTGILTLPWGQVAFAVALLYNLHLLAGWWWDRFWRDKFIEWGWYKPKSKKKYKMVEIEE